MLILNSFGADRIPEGYCLTQREFDTRGVGEYNPSTGVPFLFSKLVSDSTLLVVTVHVLPLFSFCCGG
jgi:hypothetical protein